MTELNFCNWFFFHTFIAGLFYLNFVVGDSGSFLVNKIELVSTPNQGSFWRLNWGRLSMRLLRLLLDGQDWTCLVALFSIMLEMAVLNLATSVSKSATLPFNSIFLAVNKIWLSSWVSNFLSWLIRLLLEDALFNWQIL